MVINGIKIKFLPDGGVAYDGNREPTENDLQIIYEEWEQYWIVRRWLMKAKEDFLGFWGV